jgi:hypothetical protein
MRLGVFFTLTQKRLVSLQWLYFLTEHFNLRLKVYTKKRAVNFWQGLRKKYFDARHHCFAYVLDADKKKYRAFDDGEPDHSAGDPILGQIRSKDLTNVFGGSGSIFRRNQTLVLVALLPLTRRQQKRP